MLEYQRLIARLNASGMIADPEPEQPRRKPLPKRKPHRRSILDRVDNPALLLKLLERRAALVTVDGEKYAVEQEGGVFRVQGIDLGSGMHTVVDGRCSCPSGRFRGTCAHADAVRAAHP